MTTTTKQTRQTESDTTTSQEYIERWERRLAKLDDHLELYEIKLKKANLAAREGATSMLIDLKSKRDEFRRQLEKAKTKGSDIVADLKSRLDRGWHELEAAYAKARDALNSK